MHKENIATKELFTEAAPVNHKININLMEVE